MDLTQPERGRCRLDVVVDVRLLELLLVRLDLELLHERRIRGAEQHRDDREQPHRDDRQAPLLRADVHEEQHRADHRDERQEVQRGQLRLDLGVARALDHAAL